MSELELLRSQFKSIVFHDVEVFETGDAFRVKSGKRVNKIRDYNYECVAVKVGKSYTNRNISRLVYQLFIEPEFNNKDNRYYIDTNGKKAGEYILSEFKKVRALGTHKRVFTKNEKWGRGKGEN